MASRLHRSELLDHPSRREIYRVVCERPGIAFLEVLGALRRLPELEQRVGIGMLMHHLHHLEKHHFIVSQKVGRFRRYFQNGGRYGRAKPGLALLVTPPIPVVLDVLRDAPGACQKDLAARVRERLGVTRQAVAYHLSRLAEHGLVEVELRGCQKRYRTTPLLDQLEAWLPEPLNARGADHGRTWERDPDPADAVPDAPAAPQAPEPEAMAALAHQDAFG